MLAVILFVAFWVVIGFALFFIAARGGLGGARAAFQSQTRGSRRFAGIAFFAVYVAFGIVLPVLFLTGNHANANKQVGGLRLTPAEKSGRELFAQHCGMCHFLAAASVYGQVGPNLDMLQPNKSLVLHTIAYGCLPNVSANDSQYCLGYGVMPAGILSGRDAAQVAAFVARVAGKE